MQTTDLPLSGLKLITPKVFSDARGYFYESYKQPLFATIGISSSFVQDNLSYSCRHTLRGMHFQSAPGQDKLIQILQGEIFDVALDIRPDSPTFGKWHGLILNANNPQLLFIPKGFAHGYCVLSDFALFHYKVSSLYDPATECSFRWDDPALAIAWPIKNPLLSERDQKSPFFTDLFVQAPR